MGRCWKQTRVIYKNEIDILDDATEELQHGYIITQVGEKVDTHIEDLNNPHGVTKAQINLGNVDNTADLAKPISTATQTALNLKADKTQLNNYVTTSTFDMQMLEKLEIKPNGTDLLIIGGKINPLYIDDTSYKVNHPTANSQAAMLALDVPAGTVVVRLDTPSKELFLLNSITSLNFGKLASSKF